MKKNSHRGNTGILVLFLVFAVLLTSLFILEEWKKKGKPLKLPELPAPEQPVKIKEKLQEKFKGAGRIALIIDDVGWNPDIVGQVKRIQTPMTLAILPDSPFGLKIAKELSKKQGIDLILHIPLEPECTNTNTKLLQGCLTTRMDNEELKLKIDTYIDRFSPYIVGVNHHMGSKFTTNEEKMEVLLKEIKEKNLVYIDSLTSTKSVGYTMAEKMGIKTARRDVFIDNSSDYEQICKTLDEVANIAREKGTVIAIGHARTNTIKALEEKIPELKEQGYQFVPISKVVR
jgi:polysaccharide deacetylase 2 family uncharacterized protein YibQ